MASTSGGQISVVLKEGATEPQTAFDVMTKTPYITDSDGNVTSWHHQHWLGVLHTKQLIVEGRGYYRGNLPTIGSSCTTEGWSILGKDDSGEENVIVSEGSFHPRMVVIDGRRINEAGMWRITKTVTLKSLYINGERAKKPDGSYLGDESFLEGDYTI